MSRIPEIPRLYFSADDYTIGPDLEKIAKTSAFMARVEYFGRCAESMRTFLKIADLTAPKRQLYEGIIKVLQYDNTFLSFAQDHIGVVAEAVFEQHLLEYDVDFDEYTAAIAHLEDSMNVQAKNSPSVFDVIVDSHIGKEYTACVFAIASDMVDVLNAQLSPQHVH